MVGRLLVCVAPLFLLGGCMGLEPKSHGSNPVGWPAKILSLGQEAADSEVPLYRELGRTASAAGDLLESPALLVEGVLTLDGKELLGSAEKLLIGTGGTLAALINVPFFFATSGVIDIGGEAALVNDALAHMETIEPAVWQDQDDPSRPHVFAPGTRVRASGRNLIWTLPGEGDVIQSAEVSPTLAFALGMTGMAHVAQARTWGFVVGDDHKWRQCTPRLRTVIVIHEFFHQHMQIRQGFRSWSVLYWPAYVLGAVSDDSSEHWAETGGPDGAYIVNRALQGWRTNVEHDPENSADWIESSGQ
jgi:hypothetical protein